MIRDKDLGVAINENPKAELPKGYGAREGDLFSISPAAIAGGCSHLKLDTPALGNWGSNPLENSAASKPS